MKSILKNAIRLNSIFAIMLLFTFPLESQTAVVKIQADSESCYMQGETEGVGQSDVDNCEKAHKIEKSLAYDRAMEDLKENADIHCEHGDSNCKKPDFCGYSFKARVISSKYKLVRINIDGEEVCYVRCTLKSKFSCNCETPERG